LGACSLAPVCVPSRSRELLQYSLILIADRFYDSSPRSAFIMWQFEIYYVDKPDIVQCVDCDREDEIKSIAKNGTTFGLIFGGKKSGEPAYWPTDQGWRCPDCTEDG